MIDLNLKNIDYVKSLAQNVAQNTKEDQAVYQTVTGRHRTYWFMPARIYGSGALAVVRYTPEAKRGNVLPDNGNGGLDVVADKPKGKGKSRKAE
jgi:hypothetical protein